jgi:carbonic anhydrase
MGLSRRELLFGGWTTACGCAAGAALPSMWASARNEPPKQDAASQAHQHTAEALDPQRSLELLKAGNARFASGKPTHPHETREWREAIAVAQHPYACVLGCSDSRVSPEVVFDDGLGKLFVVRQAGHVADDDTLGSIEYAVGHLNIRLVVVLGHERCGAVQAALGAVLRDDAIEGHILRLVDDIEPAVTEAQAKTPDAIDSVVRANVHQVVRRLRSCGPVLRPRVRRGEVSIVGAYYPLRTGVVEWLQV